MVIDSFTGEHAYLSNFWLANVDVFGFDFPSVEHAFVYAKNPDVYLIEWDLLTPGQIKRKGRQIKLRDNWDDIRTDCMLAAVSAKFLQNGDICAKLLNTGNATLIEGNHWHDTFWGICYGQCKSGPHAPIGDNELGCILMDVRHELTTT